jgi:nicotinamidase/pyrazinamidase
MNALLIIDLQNDFLPGGALPAPDGRGIIPVINRIMKEFDVVVASKDWHPPNTLHFENWPPHCIRDTKGAEFPEDLQVQPIDQIFLKGTGGGDQGYSAFEATNEDLQAYLEKRGVKHLFLAGLTTEYCVKATALDAIRNGHLTFIIKDAIAGVDQHPDDAEKALKDMELAGGIITDSQIMKLM